jgi:hypothetical protein
LARRGARTSLASTKTPENEGKKKFERKKLSTAGENGTCRGEKRNDDLRKNCAIIREVNNSCAEHASYLD